MKRVVLLVTGQTEKALGPSLQRVFPDVEFVVRGPWGGFTSNALPQTPLLKRLGNAPEETYLEKLVGLLVSEVAPGRRNEKPADMVVLVDDLELCNVGWPERVIEHVRTAVQAYVRHHSWESDASRERAIERLRTRCSFHLLCPMIESYFFAEPEALTRAGAKRASQFDAAVIDAEHFYVDDREFLNPPNRNPPQSRPLDGFRHSINRAEASAITLTRQPEAPTQDQRPWRFRFPPCGECLAPRTGMNLLLKVSSPKLPR